MDAPAQRARPPKNMAWIPGGAFAMGSEDFYPEERPVHTVEVDGFWMDEHPVTVAEFRRFVKATGHVTVAETAPDPLEFPDADPEQLVPGSLVFTPPSRPVSLDDFRAWWSWTPSRAVAASRRTRQHVARARPASRHPRGVRRRAGVRRLGGQGAAHRSRVGVRGAWRPGRRDVRVGRGVRAARADDGQHVAGELPAAQRAARRLRPHLTGRQVPRQRLRPGRHDRERVGVDHPGLHEQPRRGRRCRRRRPSARSRNRGAVADRIATTRRRRPRRRHRPTRRRRR